MSLQEFSGRFLVDDTNDDFSIDGNALSVSSGYVYTAGISGENEYVELFESAIQGLGGGYASVTASYSASTGKVTIANGSGSDVTIAWTDSAVASILGFSSSDLTVSDGGDESSTKTPKYIWRPSRAPADYPGNMTYFWQPRSTTYSGRNADGTAYTVKGNLLYDGDIVYVGLQESEVLKPAGGSVGSDLESWFEDVLHEGQPFRLVFDRSSYSAASDYTTAQLGDDEGGEIGSFQEYRARKIQSYNGFWDIQLPLLKVV